jgi:hypothetical protein
MWRGIGSPNLSHASEIERLAGFFSDLMGRATQGSGWRHGRRHGGAQATVHETKQGFFLHNLDYERNLFCPLTAVELGQQRRSTGRRLAAVRSSSGEASTSRSSPMSSSWPPLASRLVHCGSNQWWIAWIWWQLGFGRFWVLRVKIRRTRATIYRGFGIGS